MFLYPNFVYIYTIGITYIKRLFHQTIMYFHLFFVEGWRFPP